jgi:MFS family permease
VVALVTPLVAAWLVSRSGGITIGGLRPLYYCQVALFVGIFFLLLFLFRDPPLSEQPRKIRFVTDFTDILKSNPAAVRFLLMIALMEIPWTMVNPFMPLFAHQIKGADEFILGALGTVRFFVPFVLAIPIGRLADRWGRKKVLLALAPLTYLSNVLVILAPNPKFLLVAAFFFGFYSIGTAVVNAMAAELVPEEQMGRWIGILSLVRGMFSIPLPILAGALWDSLGPIYIFVAAILIDLLLRIPLLISVPETLRRHT